MSFGALSLRMMQAPHVGNDGDQSVRRFSLHGALEPGVLSLEKRRQNRQILPQTLIVLVIAGSPMRSFRVDSIR